MAQVNIVSRWPHATETHFGTSELFNRGITNRCLYVWWWCYWQMFPPVVCPQCWLKEVHSVLGSHPSHTDWNWWFRTNAPSSSVFVVLYVLQLFYTHPPSKNWFDEWLSDTFYSWKSPLLSCSLWLLCCQCPAPYWPLVVLNLWCSAQDHGQRQGAWNWSVN